MLKRNILTTLFVMANLLAAAAQAASSDIIILKTQDSVTVSGSGKTQGDAFYDAVKLFVAEFGQELCDAEDLGLFIAYSCQAGNWDSASGAIKVECWAYCETQL